MTAAPGLAEVQTLRDLGACLDALRAGRTLESLRRSSEGQAVTLSRSTVSDVLTGKRLPKREWLHVFLTVCGVSPDEMAAWRQALDRANRSVTGAPPEDVLAGATFLRDLGVHPAIRVPGADGDQPAYVPRDFDQELRQRVADSGFVVLVGGSSVGKTRSLAEAIKQVSPRSRLVQPADVAGVEALAEQPPAETIVWLDDLQRYLSADPGLGAATVRALVRSGVLVVGTLWPEDYQVVSAMRRPGVDDPLRRIREVLTLAEVVDVPRSLTETELGRAAELARDDARLRVALGDAALGVTQVLAAGPALIRWWEQGDPYGAAIISAAADARRLGVTVPLSRALLSDAAYGYLSPTARATAGADWLDHALSYATTPLHGAASAVAPVDGGAIGVLAGYVIADFLLQHAKATRRTVTPPDATWQALLDHADSPGTLQRLGDQAELRLQYSHAETAYRALTDVGDIWGSVALTLLLHARDRGDLAQDLARDIRRDAAASSRGALRWNLLNGLLVRRQEVRRRLRESHFAEAIKMERREPAEDDRTVILEAPSDDDLETLRMLAATGDDGAAMWLAVLAAQHGVTPELLAEVRAGTPLAAELYLLRLQSTDPAHAADVRRHGLTTG